MDQLYKLSKIEMDMRNVLNKISEAYGRNDWAARVELRNELKELCVEYKNVINNI